MQDYVNDPMEMSGLPKIATLDFKPMAKNYPALHTLETLFIWIIVWTALIIFALLNEVIKLPLWTYFVLSAFTLPSLLLSYFSAKAMGYVLRQNDLIYKNGIFWRKRTGVSFRRIQHIDITHGPVERKFKLATIKFFTAGGALADLKISGLLKSDAENLRSHILEKTGLSNG